MKFIFDIIFYPIVSIIIGLFLFYEPVATIIYLAVLLTISIIGAVLLYRHKHGR